MFKLVIIIGVVIGMAFLVFSNRVLASPEKKNINQPDETVASNAWHHAYFFGITKFRLEEVGLSKLMTQKLIQMVGVETSVSTGALIAPKYMLNSKGVTPWLAMHLASMTDEEMLNQTLKGNGSIFVPNQIIQGNFVDHINWPDRILSNFNIELEGFNVFILPFMVPSNHELDITFNQSMKAPDGSLEIFGVDVFDENKPERLLARLQSELAFIKRHRTDIHEN